MRLKTENHHKDKTRKTNYIYEPFFDPESLLGLLNHPKTNLFRNENTPPQSGATCEILLANEIDGQNGEDVESKGLQARFTLDEVFVVDWFLDVLRVLRLLFFWEWWCFERFFCMLVCGVF